MVSIICEAKEEIISLIKDKLDNLYNILSSMKNFVVAYSGGVDSTFLLNTALKTLSALSKKNLVAVTLKTDLIPDIEIEEAKKNLKDIDIEHVVLSVDIFAIDKFISNPPDRCYLCKIELFNVIKEFAKKRNIGHVVEGTNYDDSDDYRPGMRALKELEIRSPLKEAMLTKKEIRSLSEEMGLRTWNKPAMPCLATRFPYGTEITKDGLYRVENAESFVRDCGIDNLRVRAHNDIARIEVPENQMKLLIDSKISKKIIEKFKELGFTYVTIDMEGYRMGSMNESLDKEITDG